ncbi:MAG: hypothetical protein FWE95_07840, partial [Planctomycetaceae bacterium]|nr:hypothetical protein [Planctomycetaceae bacterium]
MPANNYSVFTEPLAKRVKTAVESLEMAGVPPSHENQARLLAGHTSPVEITDTWTFDGGTWKCRATRLWRIGGVYQTTQGGIEFDLYHPTSSEQPPQWIGERVFAVFRGVWELVAGVGGGESTPSNPKVRLVQPKELFPACEYKTFQDVYGCTLEHSDDNADWIEAYEFNIVGGRVQHTLNDSSSTPHQYYRINLKGFSKPEDPNDPYADRGFYTFGRLWEALFWIQREVEYEANGYKITAKVDDWQVNTDEPVSVEMTLNPKVTDGELHYRTGTGDWE